MKTYNRTITAQEAQRIIDSHINIRPISRAWVATFAADMVAGRWVQNSPQGLSFDVAGKLVDGQHRLAAQAAAGLALSWRITEGVTEDMLCSLDGGRVRDLSIRAGVTKSEVEVARMLVLAHTHNVCRLSPAQAQDVLLSLQVPGISAVLQHAGKPRMNRPVRAAFAYAWPCSPDVAVLWSALVAGTEAPAAATVEQRITWASLAGVINTRLTNNDDQQDVFMQTLRAIRGYIEKQPIKSLKTARGASFNWFRTRREDLGCPMHVPAFDLKKIIANADDAAPIAQRLVAVG